MGTTCSVVPHVAEPSRANGSEGSGGAGANGGPSSHPHKSADSKPAVPLKNQQPVKSGDKRLNLVGGAALQMELQAASPTSGGVTNPLAAGGAGGGNNSGGKQPNHNSTSNSDGDGNEIAMPMSRTNRPTTSRPFAELLSRSLLLRYHPDRVNMFNRIRGGTTTDEGYVIPTMRERLSIRRQEALMDRYEGAGNLYFVQPERPLPIPLVYIPTLDVDALNRTLVAGMTQMRKEITQVSLAVETKQQLLAVRAQIKSEVRAISTCVNCIDLDGATVATQRLLSYSKRFGLLKLLAIGLQIFLCINDILVIESVGSTFEEAVRAYLGSVEHKKDPTGAGGTSKDIPDLTTVLELYQLLLGQHPNNPALSMMAPPTEADSAAKVSIHGISLAVPKASGDTAVVSSSADSSVKGTPMSNMSCSDSGVLQPMMMSHSQARAAQMLGSSTSSALRHLNSSSGTTVTGGMLSTGSFLQFHEFHMPKVLEDDGAREVQLQLIEQVNLMLELQQMLWDTLEYLVHVVRYNAEQDWTATAR